MAKLKTQINVGSPDFESNAAALKEALESVASAAATAALGGSERARKRHLSRGKMLPRDRVAGLLDAGSDFLEIGALAAHGLYGGVVPQPV